MAPVTAMSANRVSRGGGHGCLFSLFPQSWVVPTSGVPAEAVRNVCIQNASSDTRMMSSSMDSMTTRCEVSCGSMFFAKNAAIAILPR